MTAQGRQRPPARTIARGITSVEAIVSLASIAVVIVALGTAMTVAARSATKDAVGGGYAESVADLQLLQGELMFAHAVTELSGDTVEFVADDVTGDGRPDLVRYEWSGVSGEPLTRTVNNGLPANVVSAVGDLTFSATTNAPSIGPMLTLDRVVEDAVRAAKAQTFDDGDEVRLASTTGPAIAARALEPGQATRQTFSASWAAGQLCEISRVRFRATNAGAIDSQIRVRLLTGTNAETVLFEELIDERRLAGNGFDWVTLDVARVEDIAPEDLVLEIAAIGAEPAVRLLTTTDGPAASGRTETTNGTAWPDAVGTLAFELYGSFPGAKVAATDALRSVRFKLVHADDPTRYLDSTIYLANTEIPR